MYLVFNVLVWTLVILALVCFTLQLIPLKVGVCPVCGGFRSLRIAIGTTFLKGDTVLNLDGTGAQECLICHSLFYKTEWSKDLIVLTDIFYGAQALREALAEVLLEVPSVQLQKLHTQVNNFIEGIDMPQEVYQETVQTIKSMQQAASISNEVTPKDRFNNIISAAVQMILEREAVLK